MLFCSFLQEKLYSREDLGDHPMLKGTPIKLVDLYTLLGNCPPTPPLSQHFVNVGSGEG